jgi:DNA-directed RNA polymerase specialized sigma24 family protein
MPTRNTNIALNLADDDEPAVQHQTDDSHETATDDPQTETPHTEMSDHTNPDGSVTVYATPDPDGDTTSENVPTSPLAAESSAFVNEIDHPDDFSATDRKIIALQRLHPDYSHAEISERLDIADSTVSRVCRKASLATLSEPDAIHAAFHDRTPTQQAVIAALVDDADRPPGEIATHADCSTSTVGNIRRDFAPLTRKLRTVGLPAAYTADSTDADETAADTAFVCDTCGETFETVHARNGHTAVHSTDASSAHTADTGDAPPTEQAPDDPTPPDPATPTRDGDTERADIAALRATVQQLHDAAVTEQSLCDSPASTASAAARQATCEVILTQIDAISPE